MINKVILFFALIFTLFLLCVPTPACVCVRDKIKAKGFSGQIFAVSESNPSYKEPLPNATIKLLKRTDDGDKLVVEFVADEKGHFSLENIKTGKYILEADAENYQKVVTKIKIIRSSRGKKDNLEIGLDPLVIECCVGYAKVQKINVSMLVKTRLTMGWTRAANSDFVTGRFCLT